MKNRKKTFLVFLSVLSILILSVFALVACGNAAVDNQEQQYTVKFLTQDSDNQWVEYTTLHSTGNTMALPQNPTKDNYSFDGWFTDVHFQYPFDNNNITQNIDVYAKFKQNEPSKYHTLSYLASYISSLGDNYTVNVTDYTNQEKTNYKAYYTKNARYYQNINKGIVAYDKYTHNFSYDSNGEILMGSVYLKQDAKPMVYLYDNELNRVIQNIGNIEDYEIEFSSGAKKVKDNVFYIQNKIYVERFYELCTGVQIYDDQLQDIDGISLEINISNDTPTLHIGVCDKNIDAPLITYTISDIGNTCIDKINEYIALNPKYITANNPVNVLNEYYQDTNYDMAEDLIFDVYTSNMQQPDYTITYASTNNFYWHSTQNNTAYINNFGVKLDKATIVDNKVKISSTPTDLRTFDISFFTYVMEKRDRYINTPGTDEFYIDLSTQENQKFKTFACRFLDISSEDSKLITKFSLSLDSNQNIVMTLWQDHSIGQKSWDGVLARAVLSSSSYHNDNIQIQAIEDYINAQSLISDIQDLIYSIQQIDGVKYTKESYQAMISIADKATKIISDDNTTIQQLNAIYTKLDDSLNNLIAINQI